MALTHIHRDATTTTATKSKTNKKKTGFLLFQMLSVDSLSFYKYLLLPAAMSIVCALQHN